MLQNGIAHLDNFAVVAPWDEDALAANMDQRIKREPLQDSNPGELCLLVQLLKGNRQRPGVFDVYDMPHLVSRPFTIVTRTSLVSRLAPSFAHHAALGQQDLAQLRQRQQLLYQQTLMQRAQRAGGIAQRPFVSGSAGNGGGLSPMCAGADNLGSSGLASDLGAFGNLDADTSSGAAPADTVAAAPAALLRTSLSKFGQGAIGPAGCGAVLGHDGGSLGTGLQQAPSATLLDMHSAGLQDLLEELEAHPLNFSEDLMDMEGPVKRAKSNMTTNDVAAFMSDNSSNSLLSASQRSSFVFAQQQQAQQPGFFIGGGANSSGSSSAQQVPSGGWSSNSSSERLSLLRQSAAFLGNTGPDSSFGGGLNTRSAGPVVGGGAGGSGSAQSTSSQLDALMVMLGEPGAMQEAIDRMALEQQAYEKATNHTCSNPRMRA
ncbi:hypothetical protein GPECTOR_10g895 [Gonium pectorale]|uniref:Uncharacterized protein n=1 Tax=Gonium pectorale TaxID=33097 RepID=A0A150GR45_GONPE|nr:hypothetical protein GPECTOR_10g895 [Gonium pectorale]|eukprot:KXZ52264.1 hypothetical protein GPECTOR_10g895 [Gonium pectorale]